MRKSGGANTPLGTTGAGTIVSATGAALDLNGRLLKVEHGAQGGDELNAPQAGRNYGWPVITFGENYGGGWIGEGSEKPGLEQPLHYWDPSIAPSGMMVYSGKLVPEWRGDIFFGSLNSDFLGRLDPDTPVPTGFAERCGGLFCLSQPRGADQ